MELTFQIKGPPLTRSACSDLVEMLRADAAQPGDNAVLQLAKYSFIDRPEGERDWVRADIFEYLKHRAAGFDPALKQKALGLIVGAMRNDIDDARTLYSLTAPGTIGEAVQLTLFGGDPAALRMLHFAVEPPCRFPATFYRAFEYDLAAVLREVSRVPRDENFMKALTVLGAASHGIVNVELDDVTKPDTEDNVDSTYGRAAQFGSPVSHYGMKRDMSQYEAWRSASINSHFARKMVHVKFIEIAEACGLDVAPKPPPKVELFADLRFPFFHIRRVDSGPVAPPMIQESPDKDGQP